MKILMVTNKVKTYSLSSRITFDALLSLGHKVVWAADFSKFIGDKSVIPAITEQISINTNPLNKSNIRAYKRLLKIIDEHHIEAVMCSTPIGGALARLAAKKKGIKPVLYEAHGFLFFKGAPLINRTVYKWEEQILARCTDVLITITKEDYAEAKKLKLRSKTPPYMVHGAGVNVGVQVDIDRDEKRKSLGVPEDAFVIVSAGELNRNKNTEVAVRALADVPDAHYIACGVGPEEDNLRKLANKLGVADRFHLLGYRTDMPEVLSCADAFTIMSFREGMPRALLEAMDLGLPCVGSNTRGVRDLIDIDGGFICEPTDVRAFADAFNQLKADAILREKMGKHNQTKVQDYSADVVRQELCEIYKVAFGDNTVGDKPQ
jgi:glycosyltransferase involved in cell wall biosynthesis